MILQSIPPKSVRPNDAYGMAKALGIECTLDSII